MIEPPWLNALMETGPMLVCRFIPSGGLTHINSALCDFIGRNQEMLLGKPFHQLFMPEDTGRINAVLSDLTPESGPVRHEFAMKDGTGTPRRVRWTLLYSDLPHTENAELLGIGEDITRLIETATAVNKDGMLHRTMLENLPDLCFVIDENGVYREIMGRPRESLLAKPAHELLNHSFHERLDKETADDFLKRVRSVLKSGDPHWFEYRLPTVGGEFWFEARIAPLVNTPSDKTPCVLWIARDISTRKELKVQLSDSENRYRDLYRTVRLMVNNATDLIWAKDMNDCYTFVNRATCDVLLQARTLDEPIGKNDLFFALRERKNHPEDPNWHTFGELCQASDRIVRESGKPGQFDEFGNINGQFLYLDVHKAPVRDESGKMIGTVGSARDVTRIRMMESTREQVEEQLRQSETSYRELFDLAPDAIYVQNPDGVFLDVNQHACDMYGHPKSFFIGRTPAALSAEGHNDLETVEQMVGEAFEGKTHTFEFWGKRSNGEIFPKEVIIKPGHYFGEQVVIAFSRDISARKAAEKERQELESQLRHAQKLEAVGRLAGGIAHDFNNLLTPIMGHGDMMLQMLPAKHPFREKLGSILTAADSARKLTQQLLAFGRKQILSTQKVDLNERVKHTIQLLERTLGENIRIQTTLCTEPPLVNADPTQLEQILMNLAINGRDAMPDGGVLSIETAVLTDTNEISLRVTDTGIGMDEDVMLHIFEPFFTTKNVQQGTGLGLSTVYGIVKQHQGNIQVASEPGKGSTFTINLPAADPCAEAVAGDPDIQPITDTQQKSGRILLVEDNPMILDLARNILNQHGYKVCSANRAEKARQIMEQEAHIDLLVTDVVMPGTSGIQLAGQLREYRPDLKVLFITGHAEEMVPEHELSAGRSELLPKPFTVQTLMTAVQSLLD